MDSVLMDSVSFLRSDGVPTLKGLLLIFLV